MTDLPRRLLHLEGLAVAAGALVLYFDAGYGWLLLVLLALAPDLSMLGYLAGPRIGAAAYNAGHSYISAAIVALASFTLHAHTLDLVAAIWVAHIGFDRLLGYGLKYGTAFGDTHLTRLRAPISSRDR